MSRIVSGGAPAAAIRPAPALPSWRGWVGRTFPSWSLVPALVLMAVLTLYPVLNLAWMSVSTIEFVAGRDVWTFTPGRNSDLLLSDRVLRHAIVNTAIF